MRKVINRKVYDTDKSTQLGYKYMGKFGQPDGYEEQLFVTKSGCYFIYGVGGSESLYGDPGINPLTDKQLKDWKKDRNSVIL